MSALQDDPVKVLTPVFWLAFAAVIVSLAGGIYTGISQSRAQKAAHEAAPSIPLPAIPQQ